VKMKYNNILGIGGVGTGMLFLTDENAALGRSESRLAELSDAKDYCKLHIVFHYTAVLLAPSVKIFPIGYVGQDAYGTALTEEMRLAGMDTSCIAADKNLPTMLSVCLQYPDMETCNFTASNSACNLVTPEYAQACMERIRIGASSIVAAIPEVRVESRISALRYGKAKGAFCVLSVPESEAGDFKASDAFQNCGLLAVNLNEALTLAPGEGDPRATAQRLYEYVKPKNPNVMLLVTCGKHGAYTAWNDKIEYVPCFPAEQVVTTSGAGDACLGGAMAGLAMGLPFQKGRDDFGFGETPLSSAAELGTICAGMAVETADTIAKHVNAGSIDERIERHGWKREEWFYTKPSGTP